MTKFSDLVLSAAGSRLTGRYDSPFRVSVSLPESQRPDTESARSCDSTTGDALSAPPLRWMRRTGVLVILQGGVVGGRYELKDQVGVRPEVYATIAAGLEGGGALWWTTSSMLG